MAEGTQIGDQFKLSFEDSLSIFNLPNSNLGVKDIRYLTYKPVTQFQPGSTDVRFKIPGVTANYIDLRGIYLKTKVKIVRGDGTKLPALPSNITARVTNIMSVSASEQEQKDDGSAESTASADSDEHIGSCGPVNLLSQALWDSVEVIFNDRVVYSAETNYPLKCMINALLSDTQMNNADLETSLFLKDTAFRTNNFSLLTDSNKGFMKRALLMAESREIELQAKLDIDIFKLTKYLVNGISIDINLTATNDQFRLLTANTSTTDYSLQVTDVSLVVPCVTLANQVIVSHQEVMREELSSAQYFYERMQLRKFHIASGLSSFFVEDAFQGLVPSQIILAFVSSSALNGDISKNPFSLTHSNVSQISVTVDGMPSPEGQLLLNFDKDIYLQSYYQLYRGKTQSQINENTRITLEEFRGGYTLFKIDLEPQKGDSFYPLKRQGGVRVEVRFSKQLQESVVMLARITSPGHFSVDYARNIYLTA